MTNPSDYDSYLDVPWEKRSLAIRVLEQQMGMPIEQILAVLWFKYRDLNKLAQMLGAPSYLTVGKWMHRLGLHICLACSKHTGKLFRKIEKCPGCKRNLCKDCIEKEDLVHFIPDM